MWFQHVCDHLHVVSRKLICLESSLHVSDHDFNDISQKYYSFFQCLENECTFQPQGANKNDCSLKKKMGVIFHVVSNGHKGLLLFFNWFSWQARWLVVENIVLLWCQFTCKTDDRNDKWLNCPDESIRRLTLSICFTFYLIERCLTELLYWAVVSLKRKSTSSAEFVDVILSVKGHITIHTLGTGIWTYPVCNLFAPIMWHTVFPSKKAILWGEKRFYPSEIN